MAYVLRVSGITVGCTDAAKGGHTSDDCDSGYARWEPPLAAARKDLTAADCRPMLAGRGWE